MTPGPILRRPAQIPLSAILVLVTVYTAIAPGFDEPFTNYAFASAAVFLFAARVSRKSWIVAVLAAFAFSICRISFLHVFLHVAHVAAGSMSLYAGLLGRGCLIILGWRTIWVIPDEHSRLRGIWWPALGFLSFVLASRVALNMTVWAHFRVLDFYLYVFDGSLGFQPSFLVGRVFARCRPFGDFAREIYSSLPVAIALVCAGHLNRRSPWRPLAVLAAAGVIGYFLYFVFPATGPFYVVGAAFPDAPQPYAELRHMHPHAIMPPVRAPRNAMPSLHMAWALLLWFNCRPFSRVARGLALAYVVLTVLATLGTGEHYLIDLVVAVPFAVALQALWTPVPTKARNSALICGTILTAVWLVVLRYGIGWFLLSPAIPWLCVVATTVLSLWLERQLPNPARDHPGAALSAPSKRGSLAD